MLEFPWVYRSAEPACPTTIMPLQHPQSPFLRSPRALLSAPARTMAAGAVAAILALGLLTGCSSPATPTPDVPEGLEPVWETWQALQSDFIRQDELAIGEINEAAIRGILESLDDPYSSYLTPSDYRLTTDEQQGHFGGIGAEVAARDGQIVILAPLPGSPALREGIRAGDIILAVDGESLEDKTLQEAVLIIRGTVGEPVTLRVLHEGDITPVDITVVRETIQFSRDVESRLLEPGIGYVQLRGFNEPTTQALQDAVQEMRGEGMEGLVLDLRNNGGGLLGTAISVTSQFIEEGLVLYALGAGGQRSEWEVLAGGVATDLPMVVLVNGFSASASEVVTGALQDNGRATVVGTTTFGKGSVNQLSALSNGAGLYFTIAHWYTPNGRLIEGTGLEPDVAVGEAESARAIYQLFALASPLCDAYAEVEGQVSGSEGFIDAIKQLCQPSQADAAVDTAELQLQRAVAVLKQKLGRSP